MDGSHGSRHPQGMKVKVKIPPHPVPDLSHAKPSIGASWHP